MSDVLRRWTVASSRAVYGIGAMLLFAAGAALSHQYAVSLEIERRGESAHPGSAYRPAYAVEPGEQLVLVYVGSSTCYWSNQPELVGAVKEAKLLLAEHAEARGWSFQAQGVALEWSTESGIEHLSALGAFDEVQAGNNWGNAFALSYLWADPSEAPSTPMVLVYRRTFVAPHSEATDLIYGERDRVLLSVKRGLLEITEWVDAGAPLSQMVPQGL
jgi:hypothetical protein